MNWTIRAIAPVLVVLAGIFVAGFKSDEPLLQDADAVTPLPAQSRAAEVNSYNNIKIGNGRPPLVFSITRSGNHYVTSDQTWTFTQFNNSNYFFIVQIVSLKTPSRADQRGTVQYFMARLFTSGKLDLLALPQPGQIPAPAGSECRNAPLAFFFKDREHLISAARDFFAMIYNQPFFPTTSLRIASTPEDLALLQHDLGAVRPEVVQTVPTPMLTTTPTSCDGGNLDEVEQYRRSAQAGSAEGMVRFGAMLAKGEGVAKDETQAVAWFRKAAEAGNTEGMINFGLMLYFGRGMAKDQVQAVAWFRKAAEAGNTKGMIDLGFALESGDGVAKDDAQAVAWFRKAAESGDTQGMTELGVALEQGKGVAKNQAEAVAWYRKAAESGDPEGMTDLGVMLLRGTGTSPSTDQAISWLKLATARGNDRAGRILDQIYTTAQAAPGAQQLSAGQLLTLGIGAALLLNSMTPHPSQNDAERNQRAIDTMNQDMDRERYRLGSCIWGDSWTRARNGC